jgi:flagellar protein FliS
MNPAVECAPETYARLEVESEVDTASPQRLIVMLYGGAIESLRSAKAALGRGDTAVRGTLVAKAIAIIDDGLRPAVDPTAGGDVAQNLLAVYDYMVNRLLLANLKHDDEASLDEVIALLSELKSAWDALERRGASGRAARSDVDGRAAVVRARA